MTKKIKTAKINMLLTLTCQKNNVIIDANI